MFLRGANPRCEPHVTINIWHPIKNLFPSAPASYLQIAVYQPSNLVTCNDGLHFLLACLHAGPDVQPTAGLCDQLVVLHEGPVSPGVGSTYTISVHRLHPCLLTAEA